MTNLPAVRPAESGVALTLASSDDAWRLAQRLAGTEFVPAALRNRPEAVLACVLTGDELGIRPMQALAKIHVIEGRPAISAELMRAVVLARGHEFWIQDQSSRSVTVGARRADSQRETLVTWTMDDAKRAGLEQRQTWRKFPAAMLLARATSQLCRAVFPDVLAGLTYTVEELQDGDTLGDDMEIPADAPPETPTKTTARARHKAVSKKAATASQGQGAAPPQRERPLLPGEEQQDPDPDDSAASPGDDEIVDGEIVDDDDVEALEPDEPDDVFPPDPDPPINTDQRTYTPVQAIAMRCDALGVTDRAHRLHVIGHIVGRPIGSSKELSPLELRGVLGDLNSPDAAAIVAAAGRPDAEGMSGPADAGDGPHPATPGDEALAAQEAALARTPLDADGWRDLAKRHKVKVADLLSMATHELGHTIATVDDLVATPWADIAWLLVWAERRPTR